MPKICDMDCFNCKYDDCINDKTYSEKSLYKYRSEASKQRQKEYMKKRRQMLKEKGLCTYCGKKKASQGVFCYECWLKQKKYSRRKTGERQYRKESGLCFWCGKKPIPGKKVCEEHYSFLLANIRRCQNANAENAWKRQILKRS